MSATDWLGGIGGVLGILGGPAGLYVYWLERRERSQRELKEQLLKLSDHALRLRRLGNEAADEYRDAAWWSASGGLEARNSIKELRPYVALKCPQLEALLIDVYSSYDQASAAVYAPESTDTEKRVVTSRQARHAGQLAESANDLYVRIHDLTS
ncbi:hypothetical protein [Streptomyces gobiensis]|uniref:hypothetical protein n=1 Tax=Streptomyces gobiensis TaxID=2875706 RepID=UPI001E629CFB|nr:hypothetical protein [Streptomyces gobiensis]UGY93627.1 hypothetical protein test1122_19160 [Streptomyces gobiensis]